MKIDIFGIFGPKTGKMGCAQKWVFFNFAHFFDWIKKYSKWKKIVSPNGFLVIFVILPKSQKWPKMKGGNFFRHTLIIWGDNFFVFSILFDSIKKMGKIEKKHFCTQPIFFSFWPKNAKNINFHEKIFF